MDTQIKNELERIKNNYHEFNSSEFNKTNEELTSLINEEYKLNKLHSYFLEIVSLIEKGVPVILLHIDNLTPIFTKLNKQITLEINDFIVIKDFLLACKDAYKRLHILENSPLIKDLVLDIDYLDNLIYQLTKTFNSDGSILDSASSNLYKIRIELNTTIKNQKSLLLNIKNKYKEYLENSEPVIRNGIDTLAVKSSFSDKVPGILIDRSNSQETLFILPYALIESNNKIEKLKSEELAEIYKILSDLTVVCFNNKTILEKNFYIYNVLDEYISKVLFGRSYNGTIAKIDNNSIQLNELVHPLIDPIKVVANTISLGEKKNKILVISGPNAGGKSVLLKSVGIASYMNQMGFFVPCRKESKLPIFDNILILTGDNESLSGNLSTFSGHLKGLEEIYEKATSKSLILIDEIGQGTSPKDGEAIGISFIKNIERISAFGIFTTHYDAIKKLSIENEKISAGAMEFSQENLSPTFKFLDGVIGNSYAFEVAKQIGLSENLINEAIEFKNSNSKVDIEKLEETLTLKIQKCNKLEQSLNNKLAYENELIKKRENAISSLEKEKDNIKKKANEKVDKQVNEIIKQIDELWSNSKNKNIKFNEVSELKGKIKQFTNKNESDSSKISESKEIKVGDFVRYNNMLGQVEVINKNKASITFNGMKFTVPLNELQKTTDQNIKPKYKVNSNFDNQVINTAGKNASKLNIIGFTVSEAIPLVDAFLDDALLLKRKKVIILHGMGTFALRNGIQAHLKKLDFVKDFREGNESEGALAVTVVNLK